MQTIRYVSNQEDKNNFNHYRTISEAIKSIPVNNQEPVTIFVRKGTYKEKIIIDRPFICLEGEAEEETILTYNDYAFAKMEDGSFRGTFRTPTLFIDTHDFTAKNLTIANSAGYGKQVGQALALYADGDRLIFDHCRILGSQDTIFVAPLPPSPMIPGGFTGPKEFAPRCNGRQYYRSCFIRGDVDFIFGSGTAFFEDCEIFSQRDDSVPVSSRKSEQEICGYITAASTPKGQAYGFVFSHCRLTGNCPDQSVYLGRPWRSYAQTVFLNCDLGAHIRDEGFHDWNKPEAHNSIFYAEYRSFGPGARACKEHKRASFSSELTKEESLFYTREKVLSGYDAWGATLC